MNDLVKAAKEGPFLHGTDETSNWITDEQMSNYRTELEALSKPFKTIEKKHKILKAVCDSREWKAENCNVCKNVDVDELFVDHALSASHVENLKLKNLSPSKADYNVLKNVLMKTKWCTAQADVKKVHAPFLDGFKNPERSNTPVTKSILIMRQKKFLGILGMLGSSEEAVKSMETAYMLMFSEIEINFCSKCNVKMSSSTFADHVLSDEHLGKIRDSGRYIYNTDVGFMSDLVGLCELIHNKFDDAQEIFEDDSNTLPLPFLKGRSSDAVNDDDTMSMDEVLELAREASKPEFELQRTGTELAYQRYKVRNLKCLTCAKRLNSKGVAMDHLISKEHLTKVMNSGFVFSRSLDHDVLHGASATANKKLEERKKAFANYPV